MQRAVFLISSCIYNSSCSGGQRPVAQEVPTEQVDIEGFKTVVAFEDPPLDVVVNLINRLQVLQRFEDGRDYFAERAAQTRGRPEYPWMRAAQGVFRVQSNGSVGLLRRAAYVREGIEMLDEAVDESPGFTTYLRGTVLVSLPPMFDEAARGTADLEWVVENRESFPESVVRGAFRGLARGYAALGDERAASDSLERSGHQGVEGEGTISSAFSVDPMSGFRFRSPRFVDLGSGLWQAEGYDFGDVSFVETPEGVVVIDAGTRAENTASILAELRTRTQAPLTTLVLTHAHWDHIGGARTFTDQGAMVYAQEGFSEERDVVAKQNPVPFAWFFGPNAVDLSVEPDELVSEPMTLPGSRKIELVPVRGGETHDALLVHVPDAGVIFAGDAFMPYTGAPFTEEGDPEELLSTIDAILERSARLLVHGHPPLTELWTVEAMPGLRAALAELIATTQASIAAGRPLSAAQRDNVVPELLADHPAARMPYMVMREGVIKRLYDLGTGYWQANRDGIETIGIEDWSRALDAIGGGERAYVRAVRSLLEDGEAALPLQLAEVGLVSHPQSEALQELRETALLRLRALHSVSEPFRFIVYSETVGVPLPPVPPAVSR